MRKFKIIEEKNPVTGEVSHYELWWHKPWPFIKDRWVCEQERHIRYTTNKKFAYKTDIIKHIQENYVPSVRTEVYEGVIDGNFGIQRSDGVGQ